MKSWVWILILVLVVLGLVAYGMRVRTTSSQTTQQPTPPTTTYQQPAQTPPSDAITQPISETVTLTAVDSTVIDQYGNAVITEKDGNLEVTLNLMGENGASQPAHIHEGACPGIGAVVYPLENAVNGKSTSVIEDMTLEDLKDQLPLALNVHKSAEEVSVYTACGNLEF